LFAGKVLVRWLHGGTDLGCRLAALDD